MPRIKPNDPKRITEHDFVILDYDTPGNKPPRVVAAFDNQMEAMQFCMQQAGKGRVWVIDVLHPDGCGCNPTEKGPRRGSHN
jgi:hypothetical protein